MGELQAAAELQGLQRVAALASSVAARTVRIIGRATLMCRCASSVAAGGGGRVRAPAVLVLDDLDALARAADAEGEADARVTHAVELLSDALADQDAALARAQRELLPLLRAQQALPALRSVAERAVTALLSSTVVVLATAHSPRAVHPDLLRAGVLSTVLPLPSLDARRRARALRALVRRWGADGHLLDLVRVGVVQRARRAGADARPRQERVAADTEACSAADLALLVRRCVHAASARASPTVAPALASQVMPLQLQPADMEGRAHAWLPCPRLAHCAPQPHWRDSYLRPCASCHW